MVDVDYCSDPAAVQIFPGVPEALAKLKAAGFRNVIITNQSGIVRGRITPEQYAAVHDSLLEKLGRENIDAAYFCPDFSERRKPSPAMIFEAERDLEIDLARSWFVGDKAIDIECGHNAGVRAILVKTGYGARQAECGAEFVEEDFAGAAARILSEVK